MKSAAVQRFRNKLQANEPVYGVWVTLEAGGVSDIATGLGFDWIVIDAAHGHLDWAEVLEHIRGTARSQTLALVRVGGTSPEVVRRALDLGADGVLISGAETADQLRFIIRQSSRETEAASLIVPVLNVEGNKDKLRGIISVAGVELFFFEHQGAITAAVRAAQVQLLAEIRGLGKHAGIEAENDNDLREYQEQNFRMLGVGSDAEIIRKGIQATLQAVAATARS